MFRSSFKKVVLFAALTTLVSAHQLRADDSGGVTGTDPSPRVTGPIQQPVPSSLIVSVVLAALGIA